MNWTTKEVNIHNLILRLVKWRQIKWNERIVVTHILELSWIDCSFFWLCVFYFSSTLVKSQYYLPLTVLLYWLLHILKHYLRENSAKGGVKQITKFHQVVILYNSNEHRHKKIQLLLNSNYFHRRIHGIPTSVLPYCNFLYVLK